MLIQWTSKFETGIRILDRQHLQLVEIANRLHEAIEYTGAKGCMPQILDELNDYIQVHFRTEEEMMKRYGYIERELHDHEHEDFADKIKELTASMKKDESITLELMYFLKHWISHHILEGDKDLVLFLKKQKVD